MSDDRPAWLWPRAAYVHVPFCAHHCGYCDFAVAVGQDERIDAYLDTLEIEPGDAITDNIEAYYLLQQRGIDNVIIMGVHTNMCVLGRPFAIRAMLFAEA